MFGTGSEIEGFRQIVKRDNLRVTFRGHVSREVLAKELQDIDIFVHLSRIESFGLAITEAMASGSVPVFSRVGGICDQIDHMKNGLLFEKGNATQLADCLKVLIDDQSLRNQLAENSIEKVDKFFSLKRMIERYECLYSSFIDKSKKHSL